MSGNIGSATVIARSEATRRRLCARSAKAGIDPKRTFSRHSLNDVIGRERTPLDWQILAGEMGG